MEKTLLKSFQLLVILSLFFVVGCKKDKDIISIDPEGLWVEIKGIRWSTRNVGAPGIFVANPEDKGMFYQWNRKVGWSTSEPLVNHAGGTTWDCSIPTGDSWEKANDPCPPGWRVPTHQEQKSLCYSGNFYGELNGVSGRYFGSGEQTVFFPAAGCRNSDGSLNLSIFNDGIYWSGSPGYHPITNAYFMDFNSGSAVPLFDISRASGLSVRCVSE